MKIIFRKSLPYLLIFPVIFLQLNVMPFFEIDKTVPDLTLLLSIVAALLYGQTKGIFISCYYGFLIDIFSGGLIGPQMFSKTLASFIAGYFYKPEGGENFLGSFWLLGLAFVCKFIDGVCYAFLSGENIALTLFDLIYINGIAPSIYTAIFAIPIIVFFKDKRL